MRKFLYLTLALCGLSSMAGAQNLDQTFKDWSVFRYENSCYIASAPIKQTGNYTKRGQPYLLVVHKSATADEINASGGYPYAANTPVVATIGGQQTKLFSKNDVAWTQDAAQDAQLVGALKKGSDIMIRGTSQRGTWSEDSYSLAGFSDAYARMKVLCK